jgi:hypothetical protein
MNSLTTRLRLLRQAFATDQEGRATRRRLEHELAGYSTPAERLEIEIIVARYSVDEAREVQQILDRHVA